MAAGLTALHDEPLGSASESGFRFVHAANLKPDMTARRLQTRQPGVRRVIPKEHYTRYLFRDAHLDVLDPAEPANNIDAEARGIDCFDTADRLLQHVGRHCSAALTRRLARDLGPRGITVNVVQPGPTETDMNAGEETRTMVQP